MSFVYNETKRLCFAGLLDWAAADIRVELVMANTTALTDVNANTFADITTLDACDSAGYAAAALAAETVTEDAPGYRCKGDAGDASWTALAPCTRKVVGAIVYKHTGAAANQKIPLLFINDGGFPATPHTTDFNVVWDAVGLLSIK